MPFNWFMNKPPYSGSPEGIVMKTWFETVYRYVVGETRVFRSQTASFLASEDYFYPVDTTSGNIVVTLPAASRYNYKKYSFKKTDASVNTVTITANGTDLIDGAATVQLTARYDTVEITSDAVSNWHKLNSTGGAGGPAGPAGPTGAAGAAGGPIGMPGLPGEDGEEGMSYLGNWVSPTSGGGSTIGIHEIPIMASGIHPSIVGGCSNLQLVLSHPTNANQPDVVGLYFDPTTVEYAQFSIMFPKAWDAGTITFRPYWSHVSAVTNFKVSWALQAVAVADFERIDQAYGTAQTSNDTGSHGNLTDNYIYIGPTSSPITIANSPSKGDLIYFRVYRVATDATNDTMTQDAILHGLMLTITTDASTDV